MRKKIKTPKSLTGGLPEICDFDEGFKGGNFRLHKPPLTPRKGSQGPELATNSNAG